MTNIKKVRVEDLVNQIPSPDWKDIAKGGGLANRFAESLGKKELKTTQMRKFFDEIKRIDREQREGKKWRKIEGSLYKLIPTVKYARAKDVCPERFVEFIEKSVDKVCEDDGIEKDVKLENFSKIFEYVVAYRKYIELKKEGKNEQKTRI